MNKSCLHCHQKLGFLQAVRGELFCSSEHRELYFQAEVALAFERVTSFDRPAPAPQPVAESAPAAAAPPLAEERLQPLPMEVEPLPFVPTVPDATVASVSEVKTVSLPEVKAPEVKEDERPLLIAPVAAPPIREVVEPTPETPVETPIPGTLEAKQEVTPVPVIASEPAPLPEIKLARIETPEPPAVPEAIEETALVPVAAFEPIPAPEIKEQIGEPEPAPVLEAKVETLSAPLSTPEPLSIPEPKQEVQPTPVAGIPNSAPAAFEAIPMVKPPAAKSEKKARSWVAPGIAACLAILVLGGIFFGPSKKSERSLLANATAPAAAAEKPVVGPAPAPPAASAPAQPPTSTPAPEPAVTTPPPAAAAPPPAPKAAPAPAPAAKPAAVPAPRPSPAPAPVIASTTSGVRHAALITVKENSWVAVCSDGTEVLSAMMGPGDEHKVEFSARAIVRTGNAGGIAISVDGKSVGSVGPPGGLRVVELNPQTNPHGFHLLALKPGENGACVSN